MAERCDKKCLFCDKELEPAWDSPKCAYQPNDGGEVAFTFCFGSAKYDLCPGKTLYLAVICDDCAEKYVGKMEQRLFGMDGELWSKEIQAAQNKEHAKVLVPMLEKQIEEIKKKKMHSLPDAEGAVSDARLSAESLGEAPEGSSDLLRKANAVNLFLRGHDWLQAVGEDGVDTIYVYLKRRVDKQTMDVIRTFYRSIVPEESNIKLLIEVTGQIRPCS